MAQLRLMWPRGRYRREPTPVGKERVQRLRENVARLKGELLPPDPGPRMLARGGMLKEDEMLERFVRVAWSFDYPAHDCAALYENLVRMEPDDFVSQYGLLSSRKQETVDHFLSWRRAVGQLLAAKTLGEDGWGIAKEWLQNNPKAIRLTGTHGEDEAGRLQLQFQPQDLLSFIVAQLIQDWRTGAQYRWCKRPGCHNWFYYGPGTGKRNRARYCSQTCKAADFYEKKKRKAK